MNTLTDNHAKRANRAGGAVSATEATQREIASRPPKLRSIPPSFDPKVFIARIGLTADDDDPTLASAKAAFTAVHKTVEHVHKSERAINSDPTATAAAKAMKLAAAIDRNLEAPAKVLDPVRQRIEAELREIESELTKSFRSQMERDDAAELRAILRGMDREKRRRYLTERKQAGDFAPIAAALAHPQAIASGMTDSERMTYRRDYELHHHAETLERRRRLTKARDELDGVWTRYLKHVGSLKDPRSKAYAALAGQADAAASSAVNLDEGETE